jgi:hypothetical protein
MRTSPRSNRPWHAAEVAAEMREVGLPEELAVNLVEAR